MAWTENKKETFQRRWSCLWEAAKYLRLKAGRWRLEEFTYLDFLSEMNNELVEMNGCKLISSTSTVSQWKKAKSLPNEQHLKALARVLAKYWWADDSNLEMLLGTMKDPDFKEESWQGLLEKCRPKVVLSEQIDPETGLPKVVPAPQLIQKVFRGRYGSLPAGYPADQVAAIVKRRRLVEEIVQSKKHAGRTEQGRRELAELLFMCDENLLLKMRDEGGCKPWEAPGVLE